MFNVKLKKVGGPKQYYKYSECKAGQVLVEGKFIGRSPNKFGKENFDFKPANGGPTVSLNHAGQLEYLLSEIVEGTYCRVTYNGKEVLTKGDFKGKEVNTFILEVPDEDGDEEQMEMSYESAPEEKPLDVKEVKKTEEKLKKTKKVESASAGSASPKIDLSDLD